MSDPGYFLSLIVALTLVQFQDLKQSIRSGHCDVALLLIPSDAIELHIIGYGNLEERPCRPLVGTLSEAYLFAEVNEHLGVASALGFFQFSSMFFRICCGSKTNWFPW